MEFTTAVKFSGKLHILSGDFIPSVALFKKTALFNKRDYYVIVLRVSLKAGSFTVCCKQRDIKNSVTYDLDLATRRPAMGKRASKLKPEEVDDLKAHTYCKYFVCCPRFFVVVLFSTQEPFLVK